MKLTKLLKKKTDSINLFKHFANILAAPTEFEEETGEVKVFRPKYARIETGFYLRR